MMLKKNVVMGELSLFRKGLFVALAVVGGGLFVSSCDKEELISDRTDQVK